MAKMHDPTSGKILTAHQLNVFLVDKFVNKTNGVKWPQEIVIAKFLTKIYNSQSFWESIAIDFKLNSLAWFKTPAGKKLLEEKKNLLNLDLSPKTQYNVGTKKVGNDFVEKDTKPKSIQEFLGLWQKK